jgi:hypothetical protein
MCDRTPLAQRSRRLHRAAITKRMYRCANPSVAGYAAFVCLILFSSKFVGATETKILDTDVMRDVFERDGYLILRKFFDRKELTNWHDYAFKQFERLFQHLHDSGVSRFPEHARISSSTGKIIYAMEEGTDNGYKEIVMRSPGRYDISLVNDTFPEIEKPSFDPFVQQLSQFIPKFLHQSDMSQLNMAYSLIISTPGSTEQRWHTDSEHLNMEEHLPCHCLNVLIPLVDVTPRMGPTELLPTSHYKTRQPTPYKIAVDPQNPAKAPTLKLGDALIFDYRLLHRGKPNQTDKDRPVLVLTFSQPTFYDTKNWPDRSITNCEETEPTCAVVL